MKENYKSELGIKCLAEEDRPREKLLSKGRQALTDAELLAILIGSGTPDTNAVELSKLVLKAAENNLNKLATFSLGELTKTKGIGPAKALTIVSALELGRRRKAEDALQKPQIKCSQDVHALLYPDLADLPHEELWALYLNKANFVVKKMQISKGGFSGTVADPKPIFAEALEQKACALIIAHNHPSGNLKPSQADIQMTKKIKEVGNALDLPLLDHIIFSNKGFYSFADEGAL